LDSQNSFFKSDFYCHKLRLVIEVDGKIHEYQKEYDEYRTSILNGLGLTVIRFSNMDVLENWKFVETEILKFKSMKLDLSLSRFS
jgi:very-short-patch-repair endonuclease